MNLNHFRRRRTLAARRSGLSLAELLLSIAVVSMIMTAVATLADAVRTAQQTVNELGGAVQHAQLALHRIRRHIETATANSLFPGFVVFGDQIGSQTFPDILVVWHPEGSAADPAGLPRWDELVVFGPDSLDPERLVEVTWPDDPQIVPALANTADWQQRLDAALRGESGRAVLLASGLRTAPVTGRRSRLTSAQAAPRGAALRFDAQLVPSNEQFAALAAGRIAWSDLSWSQGIHSATTGLRQHGCRIELQLRAAGSDAADAALPFCESAVAYFEVIQP